MEQIRKWQQQANMARYMLLGTVIATVINLVLLLADSDLYIVYSSAAAYYLGWFGWLFDGGIPGTLTAIGLALAAIILVGYMLVWFFAKNSITWLKVGLVMVALDALVLVILIFLLDAELMNFFWELALHGAVIYEMVMGISARQKLSAFPLQEFPTE